MGRTPKELAPDAVRALREYSWPGNVRELEHAVEHAFVLSRGTWIGAADLPFRVDAPQDVASTTPPRPSAATEARALLGERASLGDRPYAEAKRAAMERFDEAYVRELLRRSNGNVSEAARKAGLDRSNFRRILRKYKAG
jgi:DNA-binding NtrC family response regulator